MILRGCTLLVQIIYMKKIICLPLFLLFSISIFSQQSQSPALSKEYYLQKSKNQKTTGWVLLAGGTAIAIGGGILFGNSDFLSGDSNADAGGYLMLGGIAADLISIPFFISSAKNARKAASLSFNNQKILLRGESNCMVRLHSAICLKIEL